MSNEKKKVTSQIEKIVLQITRHKRLYEEGRPEVSDEAYDKLEQQLRDIDPENKVLQEVGHEPGPQSRKKKVRHNPKMLSLDKTYKSDELIEWAKGHDLVSSFKIDGVSCSLVYEQGELCLAKTRGNGTWGEDITPKVLLLTDLPKKISYQNDVEVRGEIFCRQVQFEKLSKTMVELGLEAPTSQRNIVAGLLGRKENNDLVSFLSFAGFEVISENLKFEKEEEKFAWMVQNKIPSEQCSIHEELSGLGTVIEKTKKFMEDGDYLVDGLVFTLRETSLHDLLGETTHHPRYKMAFKFQGLSGNSKIREIEWSISRNGILTPVAKIDPIELSGALVSRVTLHNLGVVEKEQLKAGDTIEIVRSGEVIPKFLSVVKSAKGLPNIPSHCLECGSKTIKDKIRLWCKNQDCRGRMLQEIAFFVSQMNIDDISAKRIEALWDAGMVRGPADLFRLSKDDFLLLEKVKEKLATRFITNIQSRRRPNLLTFVSSLGLAGSGRATCEKIIQSGFRTLEKFRELSLEDLLKVEGMAEKSAQDFYLDLQNKQSLIDSLLSAGLEVESAKILGNGRLEGVKIAITGTLEQKRAVWEQKIREEGGIVVNSVSEKTDYLLSNTQNGGSTKLKNALKFKTSIISEQQFTEKFFTE